MKLITITRILGKLDQIPAKHFLGNFSRLPEWNLHKKTVDAVLFLDPPFNTTARDCPQEWRNRKEKSLILKYEKRGLLRPLLPIIPFFCDSSFLSRRSLIRVELKIKKKEKKERMVWYAILELAGRGVGTGRFPVAPRQYTCPFVPRRLSGP